MTITKGLLLAGAPALVAASTAIAGGTFRGSASDFTRITSSGTVMVANGEGRRASVRARYVLPGRWRRGSSLSARTIRFDTRNSCRHKVTFTPRMVQAQDVPAAERAAAALPATREYVRATGTRESAAFRVIRRRGSADVAGVLVQPLDHRNTPGTPEGARVYAEISARGTYDRRTEYHAGGPRTVADAIGDAFAAGGVGGFVLRR
jgi:hypothetical protein